MIKITKYEFTEVQCENHWANFATFGECTTFDTTHYQDMHEVKLRLNDGKCYQVGMDQSTSCTGIFIKDYNNTVAYMIGVGRRRGDTADSFIWDLEQLLHNIFEGALVSHVVYERPINTESYRSSQVLFQLEGMILQLARRYMEFKTAVIDAIENSSWRRVVISSEYKHLGDRKLTSELSIRKVFKWTDLYGKSVGNDRDEFEAMGVFFGWFFNSYDALGRPYVRGDRYPGGVGGFILPDVTAEELDAELKQRGLNSRWLMENPRKSIFENLVCGVEKYQVVCVELSSLPSMLSLIVECNFKWENPKKMTVVLVPVNYVDSKLFDITGKEYHFFV